MSSERLRMTRLDPPPGLPCTYCWGNWRIRKYNKLRHWLLSHSFIKYNAEMTFDSSALDETGWQILEQLQEDGRMSFAELGRRVGLTLPAVAERVRRMEDAGVITGFRAEVNAAKIGLPIAAFIRISIVGDVFARVATAVREMPEVLECHRGTGADSFTLKVAVESVQHLERLIDKLTPFGTTSTSIVLSTLVKHRAFTQRNPRREVAASSKRRAT
jgi:Lrp/AsnC family transcriptional regulator, leucine-responsive regulatory protein